MKSVMETDIHLILINGLFICVRYFQDMADAPPYLVSWLRIDYPRFNSAPAIGRLFEKVVLHSRCRRNRLANGKGMNLTIFKVSLKVAVCMICKISQSDRHSIT